MVKNKFKENIKKINKNKQAKHYVYIFFKQLD